MFFRSALPSALQTDTLAQRKLALRLRSAVLREQLAADLAALSPVASGIDRVRAGWRWAQEHPVWWGAALVCLVAWKPRRMLATGWRIWTGWRWARRMWGSLQARLRSG